MASLDVPHGSSPPATSRASTLADEELDTKTKIEQTTADEKAGTETASRNSVSDSKPADAEKAAENAPATDELSEDEYPQGFALIAVVIALALSIFLIALDMVSTTVSIPGGSSKLISSADHHRYGYPQDHR